MPALLIAAYVSPVQAQETVIPKQNIRNGYDVDYVYKGMKYRSRLPYDPGNRLRVQVSITPFVPPAGDR